MGFLWSSMLVLGTAILVTYVPKLLKQPRGVPIDCSAAPGWASVVDVFQHNLQNRVESGAGYAVYHQGELVVDCVGGFADEEALVDWQRNTLTQAFSATKAIAAVIIAMLVDRGLLDYDRPVAEYWPEFAQNGKDTITVEQLLSHQAGLVAIDEQFTTQDLLEDPQQLGDILARQKPAWQPGSQAGYHTITFGLYLDQLVRRADPQHRDIREFFVEEIAEPFGLDFYIGLPLEENYRSTRMYPASLLNLQLLFAPRYWGLFWSMGFDKSSLVSRSIQEKGLTLDTMFAGFNDPWKRQIPTPTSHGFGTARSLAKFYSILVQGGDEKDKVLLSPEVLGKLTQGIVSGIDLTLGWNATYSRGLHLTQSTLGDPVFGMCGTGGQMAGAVPKYKLASAYLTNHHSIFYAGDDPRYLSLQAAAEKCAKNMHKEK